MGQAKLFNGKLTREQLNSLVDRAADLIRNAVDYKFILVLLFLKRLNDVWKSETKTAKERLIKEARLSEEDAEKEAENEVYHSTNIPKKFLWDVITKDIKNLPENLANSISETAKLNKELQGVIDRIDFLEFARNHAYHAEQISMCIEATYEEKMKHARMCEAKPHGRDLKDNPHDPYMQMVYETGTSYFVMEVELDESDR